MVWAEELWAWDLIWGPSSHLGDVSTSFTPRTSIPLETKRLITVSLFYFPKSEDAVKMTVLG